MCEQKFRLSPPRHAVLVQETVKGALPEPPTCLRQGSAGQPWSPPSPARGGGWMSAHQAGRAQLTGLETALT